MHLRLDMYINGKEYLIAEAPVSEDGFEACLNASDAINSAIAADIRAGGTALMTADMLDERMIDVFWDIIEREISPRDEITFCMCLWEGDTHIRSMVGIESI